MSPSLSSLTGNIPAMMDRVSGFRAGTLADQVPYSVRAVRDWWRASDQYGWLLFAGLIVLGLLLAYIVVRNYRSSPRRGALPVTDNPDRLFDDLLAQLDLTTSERKLLRQIASGARLRHPSMCLLSPGLLDWARKPYLAEKGPGIVNESNAARIEDIAVRLYDHSPNRDKAILCEDPAT